MDAGDIIISIISGSAFTSGVVSLYISRNTLLANKHLKQRDYLVERYNILIEIFAEVETFLDCGMTARHVESETYSEEHQLGVFNYYIWKAKGLLLSLDSEVLQHCADELITANEGDISTKQMDDDIDESEKKRRLCYGFKEKRETNRRLFIEVLAELSKLIKEVEKKI